MVQLNRKGKLARFYLTVSGNDLPDDFCSYFWGLLACVARVLFFGSICIVIVIAVVFALVGLALWGWRHRVPISLSTLGVGMLALTIWLAGRKKNFKIEILSEAGSIITEKIKAVKGRYCPRIEWR